MISNSICDFRKFTILQSNIPFPVHSANIFPHAGRTPDSNASFSHFFRITAALMLSVHIKILEMQTAAVMQKSKYFDFLQ